MKQPEKDQPMDNAFYAPDPRARWKQWLQRMLFPATHFGPVFEPQDPAWAPGECLTGVRITVGWADRLRLLVSGHCEVQTRFRTDVLIGRMESASHFTVQPPKILQR